MIQDNQTNTIYFSELLKTDKRYKSTYNEIEKALDSIGINFKLIPKTKDIWARDYMPIQISDDKFIEYRYDPDYLQGKQKSRRNLKTYPDIVCDTLNINTIKSDLIIDGGNIIKSDDCIIMTDKIVLENRYFYSKTDLIKKLKSTFDVSNVVLFEWDKREEYGHSDGVLRFIDNNKILISSIYKYDLKLQKSLKRAGKSFVFLEVDESNKYSWAYINYLQTKDVILLPKFDVEEDGVVFRQFQKLFPQYADNKMIVQIDVRDVVKEGGALNCISWTTKE